MPSELKVNKLSPYTGSTLTIGDSGDTISFASGVLPSLESLTITGDLTVDTNTLYVDSANNRVGIGTSSPSRLLELSSSGPIFRITDTTNNAYGEILVNDLGSITLRADEGNSQGNSIIQFDVDGSEAMRIDSSGNVLIGATSTASSNYGAKFLKDSTTSEILAIHRQANDGDFIQFTRGGNDSGNIKHSGGNLVINAVNDFEIQTNDGTDVVHVGSNGNVGIGTSSPSNPLHLSSTSYPQFAIQNSTSTYRMGVDSNQKLIFDPISGSTRNIIFQNSGAGEINVGIGTSSPSKTLDIQGTTPVLRVKDDTPASGIEISADSSANGSILLKSAGELNIGAVNDNPSSIITFDTRTSERMRIASNGNVGIGTSSPSGILHLDMGTPDIVAELTANSPTFTYRNGTGAWFHAGKHPTNDYFYIGDGATTTTNIRMVIDSSGRVGIGTSSPTAKLDVTGTDGAVQINDDGSQILYTKNGFNFLTASGASATLQIQASGASGKLTFVTNASERMRIDSSGRVGIGTSSPSSKLHVVNSNAATQFQLEHASATNPVVLGEDSTSNLRIYTGGSESVRIDSSGNVLVGRTDNPSGVSNCIYALGNYGITTGSGANVFINSEGLFFRSTSSLRYKNTINDATHGLTELLTLRPVTYKGNNDGNKIFGGLIAEEVHEAGLTEFVEYDDEGNPDALHYGNMVSLCIKAIQELKADNDALRDRIEALENA